MIRSQYWRQVPSEPVIAALPELVWQRNGEKSPARETVALMIYTALALMAEIDTTELREIKQIAAASYDDLEQATYLSRKLVADGLSRLEELLLISRHGSHQTRHYQITWPAPTNEKPVPGWFKLPSQAIVKAQRIMPFQNFTMRSKHELHALKLFFYLAACRSNTWMYSVASYETIYDRIRIQERDIRKAIGWLITTGLLRNVDRKTEGADGVTFGPNRYYLAGCDKLGTYNGPSLTTPTADGFEAIL